MKDLYEKEGQVLSHAKEYLGQLQCGEAELRVEEYAALAGEYEQLLRQLKWIARISDLTTLELNTDKATLMDKVNVDALTEIYNRRFLMTNLQQNFEELRNAGKWLTLMMLDVDFFKNYNDIYGHSMGDNCLRKIAGTIHGCLSGADDFVVRYGGEEFVAVLPDADEERGSMIAEKILESVRNLGIPHEKSSVSDCVTISIGLISSIPQQGQKMEQYIDKADAALYMSKNSGRNRLTRLGFEVQ